MKNLFFVFILVLATFLLNAQLSNDSVIKSVPFEKSATSFLFKSNYDSTLPDPVFRQLAEELLKTTTHSSNKSSFDTLARLNLLAGRSFEALHNIDSFEHSFYKEEQDWTSTFNAPIHLYVLAIAQADKLSFPEAFNIGFNQYVQITPESIADPATCYFNRPYQPIYNLFQQEIKAKINSDVITHADGMRLCFLYANYLIARNVTKIGLPIANKYINQKYIIEDSIRIKTRDGAVLSGIVIRKRTMAMALPAIFRFDIYPGPIDRFMCILSALHGYVGVVFNQRGKYLSTGSIEPFEHDARDAYDAIDWMSKQPWCNGKVGMFGGSYLGFAQWAAAKSMHPALKTIVPQVAVGAGIDFPMEHNIFSAYSLRWLHYVTNNSTTDNAEFNNEQYWQALKVKWYQSGTSFRSMDTLDKRPHPIFQRWLQHPEFDTYWQSMTPNSYEFRRLKIPILSMTGYFDDDQMGALYYFKEHYKHNKNANHYLLIGPYDHASGQGVPKSFSDGYQKDSAAMINILDIVYNWFDWILKGKAKPSILKDKINFQVMGTNEWRHTPTLKAINNDTITFFLSKGQTSNILSTTQFKNTEYINEMLDFKTRADSGNTKPVEFLTTTIDTSRAIVFKSQPLKTDMILNGEIAACFNVKVNKKDFDPTFSVYEEMPDGRYFLLCFYLGRASFNRSHKSRQLLTPNSLTSLLVNNTFFTSRRIQKGSKIILVLKTNKSNRVQLNYGTGEDVSDETIMDGKEPLNVKWFNTSYIKFSVWR